MVTKESRRCRHFFRTRTARLPGESGQIWLAQPPPPPSGWGESHHRPLSALLYRRSKLGPSLSPRLPCILIATPQRYSLFRWFSECSFGRWRATIVFIAPPFSGGAGSRRPAINRRKKRLPNYCPAESRPPRPCWSGAGVGHAQGDSPMRRAPFPGIPGMTYVVGGGEATRGLNLRGCAGSYHASRAQNEQ